MSDSLQTLCELGQQRLMRMEYLLAETALARAEEIAWADRDFDTLARLYMPLQECRRQRRQLCGEGTVCLDLLAAGPDDRLDPHRLINEFPHGQLLIAGWGSIATALEFRRLRAERGFYVDTFLAAIYPVTGGGRILVVVPDDELILPGPRAQSIEELSQQLPIRSLVLKVDELPVGRRKGDSQTFGTVMRLWERLHMPYLRWADAQADPIEKIEGYRRTLRVDYACELAHQKLADAAHALARRARSHPGEVK